MPNYILRFFYANSVNCLYIEDKSSVAELVIYIGAELVKIARTTGAIGFLFFCQLLQKAKLHNLLLKVAAVNWAFQHAGV